MTPSISPVAGMLPQQPAPTSVYSASLTPALTAPAPATGATFPDTRGAAQLTNVAFPEAGSSSVQAVQGAQTLTQDQIVAKLQELVSVLTRLLELVRAQGGVVAGGASTGQCGMAGCTMDHSAAQLAPVQGGANAAETPSNADMQQSPSAPRAQSPAGNAPAPAARVNPSSVKDKTSTSGLTKASIRGLEEAHSFGLPLVSGKRAPGAMKSDHSHGNAIDVGTLDIGVAKSDGGTPQMKAFAEHMRQQGKAGKLNVKYIIADGRIASASNGWAWREYTYPGKTSSELEALKRSNRGEFNRIQHYDHVHVSFS